MIKTHFTNKERTEGFVMVYDICGMRLLGLYKFKNPTELIKSMAKAREKLDKIDILKK